MLQLQYLNVRSESMARAKMQSVQPTQPCHPALQSGDITAQLKQYLELCESQHIDFYDCLAHARIEYDKARYQGLAH